MNSQIILCKNIKIDRNYNHVLHYNNNEMLSLCRSQNCYINSKNDFSFIRTNKSIHVSFTYNECLSASYIAFQNPDYSNKWFFAWIDEINYINNENTEIKYTIDAWSTWFDEMIFKPCFIKRNHVLDDSVGLHTVNEDLNIGDLICDRTNWVNELGSESYYWIVIASNYNPSQGGSAQGFSGIMRYANYIQGNWWFCWLCNINNPRNYYK